MLMNITAEMGRNGYTHKHMCKILNVSYPTFRGYLRGRPIPSDKLKQMATLFGKTADYLLVEYTEKGSGNETG